MKMSTIRFTAFFFVVDFVLFSSINFAQNEASTCFFGNVGLDFRAVPPQPIYPISMLSKESPASMCDSKGNILFYTNGGNNPLSPANLGAIWNANHQIMENGMLVDSGGCLSAYQGSIAVPFPTGPQKSNGNLYYLFMRDCLESSFSSQATNSGLNYAVIDMNQNGGLGKVIEKYVPLVPYSYATIQSTSLEPVSAILQGNNMDYWLFSYTNDSLYRLSITEQGIGDLTMLVPGNGRISISPNRDFLCCGNDVYQFDPFTGDISFLGTVTSSSESLTFSPDGSKLYSIDNAGLYQYDLSQSNFLSTQSLISSSSNGKLWLAPNHMIYVYQGGFLGRIRCPNELGTSCDFSMQATSLGGGITENECTNLMAHYLYYSGSCTADSPELKPNDRKLLRIVDFMGTETDFKPNSLLIYIYDDGTTAKVFQFEY